MHRFYKLALLTCTALFLTWPMTGQVRDASDIRIDVNGGSGPTFTNLSILPGSIRTFDLQLEHSGGMQPATLYRVDSTHGNSLALFDQMGRPENLTNDQISKLQNAGLMPPLEHLKLKDGRIIVSVPAYGLAVLVVQKR